MAKNSGQKLYGVFKSNYLRHHDMPYRGSVYRDAGMLKRVAEEIGDDTLEQVINYYFQTRSKHEVVWVCFNYNDILNEIELSEKDRLKRQLVRERTRRRIEELGIPLGINTVPQDLQGFVCSQCNASWTRPKQPGRPPKKCNECRGIK